MLLALACFGVLFNFDILEFEQYPMHLYAKFFNVSIGMILFSIGGLLLFRQKQWLRFDPTNGIVWVEEKKTPFHRRSAIPLPYEQLNFKVNTYTKTSTSDVKEWDAVEGKMLATGTKKTSTRHEHSVNLRMKYIKPIEIHRFTNILIENGALRTNTILNVLQSVAMPAPSAKISIRNSMLEVLRYSGKIDNASNPIKYQWKKPFNIVQRILILLLMIGLIICFSEGKVDRIFGRDFYLGIFLLITLTAWVYTLLLALKTHCFLILSTDTLEYKFWKKSMIKKEVFQSGTFASDKETYPLGFLFGRNIEHIIDPLPFRALQYLFLEHKIEENFPNKS